MNPEGKRLLVIAGGPWQVPLVQKARSLGCYVINSNLYPDSPAFQFADETAVIDVRDFRENLELAKRHDIDGVVTDQTDLAVPTVAHIAEAMGLRGIGAACAGLYTDKFQMRQYCRRLGHPVPRFELCSSVEQAVDFQKGLDAPMVLKPAQNQASRGVSVVPRSEDPERAFRYAMTHACEGGVLAEEFIGGTEFTVDGFTNGTKHTSLAISVKQQFESNPMVSRRIAFTNHHRDFSLNDLRQLNDRIVEQSGLPFGVTHVEYKFWNDRFYLIEMAARGGGTRISSDIVPIMSGVDSNELLIRAALGEAPASVAPADMGQIALLEFLSLPPGKLVRLEISPSIDDLEGLVHWGLNVKPGDAIGEVLDDTQRHGYVILRAESAQALESLLERFRRSINPIYE